MIPSNPSTDNGSQVNQMTCQFTTGFSEKKKQLCFQRPKLQEHLWGRFSSSAPWKIGNMLGRQFFSFAFGGQRYLFSRAICIYIYIYSLNLGLGLGILSQPVVALFHVNRFTFGCGNPCFGFKDAAARSPATKLAVHNNCSPWFFGPKKLHLHKWWVGSWKLELLKDLMFFFVSQLLFSFALPLLIGELDCWRFEVLFYPFFGDEASIKVSE